MKRVLLFSRDPGGANTVIPLIKALAAKGYDVHLFGKDVALSKYMQSGVKGIDLASVIPGKIEPATLREFLARIKPDVIVTGTSADDMTEKWLWNLASEMGIPSMAIQDQWLNYGIRFSPYGVGEIEKYSQDRVHSFLPTRIVAPDEFAREEMIADGLPADRIIVGGQPYFETLLASRSDSCGLARLNEINQVSDGDFVVVFASEPMTTTFGDAALNYWGYNELTILSSLVDALNQLAPHVPAPVKLIVRPHPKEKREHFSEVLRNLRGVRWTFDTESSPWTLMNRADLVCGMSSMFLIESVILGRPVLSVQIGLRRENPFILDRRDILKSVLSEPDLQAKLNALLIDGEKPSYCFDVIRDSVARIISEMESLIWQRSQ